MKFIARIFVGVCLVSIFNTPSFSKPTFPKPDPHYLMFYEFYIKGLFSYARDDLTFFCGYGEQLNKEKGISFWNRENMDALKKTSDNNYDAGLVISKNDVFKLTILAISYSMGKVCPNVW